MLEAPGYIIVTLKAYAEDGQYVSECLELDVASCGDTLDEAFRNIEDAVAVYLDTLDDVGERERVFAERGITPVVGVATHQRTPVQIAAEPQEFVTAHVVLLRPTRAA